MRVGLHAILLLAGVAWLAADTTSKNIRTEEELQILDSLTEGSNKFAIALYRAISQNATNNVVVSPVSLQLVLALTYCGAKGKTASEISQVLGLSSDLKDVQIGHKLLLEDLQHPVLKMANNIFIEDSIELAEGFQSTAKDYFLTVAQKCDFRNDTEECRNIINSWVEDKTNKTIKDLLAPGTIDEETRLVLTNAIYFNDKWKYKYKKRRTRKEPFHVTPTHKVTVDMMHLVTRLNFKHPTELGAKILELPYKSKKFRMIVILPDALDGLSGVEDKLLTINLAQEISNLTTEYVSIALPKFKLEKTMDMNPILQAMGITTMFDKEADLSGISETSLQVSQVFQKAFFEVDENGTKASAGTGVTVTRKMAPPPPIYFKADHPFLFILLNRDSSVLFIGSIRNFN